MRSFVRVSVRSHGAAPIALCRFDLNQLVQHTSHGLADQVHAVTSAEPVQEFGHGRL